MDLSPESVLSSESCKFFAQFIPTFDVWTAHPWQIPCIMHTPHIIPFRVYGVHPAPNLHTATIKTAYTYINVVCMRSISESGCHASHCLSPNSPMETRFTHKFRPWGPVPRGMSKANRAHVIMKMLRGRGWSTLYSSRLQRAGRLSWNTARASNGGFVQSSGTN